MKSLKSLLLLLVLLSTAACGDDSASDGGADADTGVMDSRVDTAPFDTGPRCDPVCSSVEACCAADAGGVACLRIADDVNNCGGCGIACADGRGTTCELSSCVCGRIAMGCLGSDRSWCCPPREPTGMHYCADFTNDTQDCGGCNQQCSAETSSDCRASTCVCGDTGGPCAGTPEDLCCAEASTGVFSCVDTTSDSFHCGSCDKVCMVGERCEMSTCGFGASCPAACASGEICCDGTCCDRVSCSRGEC